MQTLIRGPSDLVLHCLKSYQCSIKKYRVLKEVRVNICCPVLNLQAGELTGQSATAGEDYAVVTNGYILIDEGILKGYVPLNIYADSIPEMDEKFIAYLTRVDVTGEPPAPENSPYVGDIRNVTVTILANDDTYGSFSVYSDSPLATQNGHMIHVEEKENLAVDLIVERRGK